MTTYEFIIMTNDGEDTHTSTVMARDILEAAAYAAIECDANWVDCRVIEIKEVW